jgi:hypothetical protein
MDDILKLSIEVGFKRMQASYQIYIDKKLVGHSNVYRVLVTANDSVCYVGAFVDHDAHGKIYQGKVTQVFSNGKAKIQTNDKVHLYLERSFKGNHLNVGESVWAQTHSVSSMEMDHKDLKATLNIALPCGPVLLYPFEPGIHMSHRLKQYPEFANNLKLQFESLSGRFGVKFRLSAKDYSYALLGKIIAFLKTTWDQERYNKPHFAMMNALLPYFLSPTDVFTNDASFCEELMTDIETIFDCRIKIKGLPLDTEFLEDAWDRASSKGFPLLNDGSMLIDETHACTAIDINAGSDHSYTNVNREVLEILPKILYQGRFGGKVVVDLLPIGNREETDRLIRLFESGWADIDISPQMYGVSKMGLLEFILPRRGYPLWWINKKILKN